MTTARPSRRYLALLAGGPLLADLMLTLITFSMNLALVRQGLPPRLQSWVLTIFAIGYTLSASLTGRIISLRWAGTLLVVFNVLMAVTGSLGVLLQNYALLLAASGLVGVVSAVYFVAYSNPPHLTPQNTGMGTKASFQLLQGGESLLLCDYQNTQERSFHPYVLVLQSNQAISSACNIQGFSYRKELRHGEIHL